jgi:hypothetical protein
VNRDLRIDLRVTPAEYQWLKGLSMKHGRSMADVARFLLFAGMPAEASAAAAPSAEDDPLGQFLARHPWGR